ncbi:MAG: UDP-N-acetylglucosamine 2-epimerase [Deltaproteobacteria bacterium]|nr:UDP-N-acetylglucosamine 2-epimerase [Deltaproteobacteria bacterium]
MTGSTAIDALQHALHLDCDLQYTSVSAVPFDQPVLLVTVRSEETDLTDEICSALRRIATHYGSRIHIVYVKCIDPAADESMDSILGDLENVTVVPPLDYLVFVHLLSRCQLVLTDSGGVQEEACSLGKPVLLLSNVTDRIEALAEGTTKLVGTAETGIVKEVQQLLDDRSVYAAMAQPSKLFGDGRAAAVICHELLHSESSGANVP